MRRNHWTGVRGTAVVCCLAAVLLLVAACGNASNSATSPGKSSDTVTWAESAGNTPDWIWPFMPASKESNMNLSVQFMVLRPLYYFGGDGSATVTPSISLAQQPSYRANGTPKWTA